MADPDKASKAERKRKKASKLKQNLIWGATAVSFMSIAALPTMLIVGIGMLPTITAIISERHHRRLAASTMGPLNAVALLPPLFELWSTSHTVPVAMDLLFEPFALLFILGASAVGAACFHGIPQMIELGMSYNAQIALNKHRAAQEKIVEEWGSTVIERPKGKKA